MASIKLNSQEIVSFKSSGIVLFVYDSLLTKSFKYILLPELMSFRRFNNLFTHSS